MAPPAPARTTAPRPAVPVPPPIQPSRGPISARTALPVHVPVLRQAEPPGARVRPVHERAAHVPPPAPSSHGEARGPHQGPQTVQLKKGGGRGAREQEKQLRKKANQRQQQAKLSGWKMWSTAMRGNDSVSSESGTDTDESERIDNYIQGSTFNWPWNGKPQLEGRPHRSCAEAHVYALLIERNQNPKTYTLRSYNSQGKLAPPCRNCKTWVESAFKKVEGLTASYRAASTQSPDRAGPGRRWE